MPDSYTVNEIQLVYKRQASFQNMSQIHGAESAYHILRSQWDENRINLVEDFKILLLNRAMRVMGIYHVSSGSTTAAIVDTKLIFVAALKANASSIILAHNHPSGNLAPSAEDKRMTERMKIAGDVLDVKVQDHIILTPEGFYSFSNDMAFQKVCRFGTEQFEALQPF